MSYGGEGHFNSKFEERYKSAALNWLFQVSEHMMRIVKYERKSSE